MKRIKRTVGGMRKKDTETEGKECRWKRLVEARRENRERAVLERKN